MVLAASIRRCLPRIRAVDSRGFLTSSNLFEQFKASDIKYVHHALPSHQNWPYLFAAAATASSFVDDGPADAAQCSPPVAFALQKGGRRSIKDADSYLLDFLDPNDRAFDLATTRGFNINDAREYAGAKDSITYQGLSQRVHRWKNQQKLLEKEESAAQSLASMRHVSNGISTGGTSSTASATPLATTTTKGARKRRGRVTPPADLGLTTFDKSPTSIGKTIRELAALDVSIEAMLDWVDKEKMSPEVSQGGEGE